MPCLLISDITKRTNKKYTYIKTFGVLHVIGIYSRYMINYVCVEHTLSFDTDYTDDEVNDPVEDDIDIIIINYTNPNPL